LTGRTIVSSATLELIATITKRVPRAHRRSDFFDKTWRPGEIERLDLGSNGRHAQAKR
jgi:hypothetical protein